MVQPLRGRIRCVCRNCQIKTESPEAYPIRRITIRCTRSRGPRGFFCLQDVRRGPVNVAVIPRRRRFLACVIVARPDGETRPLPRDAAASIDSSTPPTLFSGRAALGAQLLGSHLALRIGGVSSLRSCRVARHGMPSSVSFVPVTQPRRCVGVAG